MKNETTPEEIASVRAAIEGVRQSLAALVQLEEAQRQDRVDYGAWYRAAALRKLAFDCRDAASAEAYSHDMAQAALWAELFSREPGQKLELQHQLGMKTRELLDAIWQTFSYFEAKMNPAESLAMLGSEGLIATAESILSRRLPPHQHFPEVAGPVDRGWLERSYRQLLAGATVDR